MTIRLRTAFFIFIGFLIVWFLYLENQILGPFIAGGIFAYIFNPVVNFFSKKMRLPRSLSVIVIYLILMSIIVYLSTLLTTRLLAESSEIRLFATTFLSTARTQFDGVPDWLKPTVYDILQSTRRLTLEQPQSLVLFFPQAISRLIGFLIFLFSGYYFMKEGQSMIDQILHFVPNDLRIDVEILLRKINSVLNGYLRGQIFLVFLMSIFTFIALSLIGVRFALLLGLFSGFAEIIPVVGPIVACALAVAVVLITQTSTFGLQPIHIAFIVIGIYFVLRHLEDYFVIPHVMGKITKLSPFVIFFAVIAGGHLWGILGLILAVPVAAVIRILMEFFLDQINGTKRHHHIAPGSE